MNYLQIVREWCALDFPLQAEALEHRRVDSNTPPPANYLAQNTLDH